MFVTGAMFHRSPLAQMEEERREHVMKMKKMEAEMEQVFEMKVKEKKQKLKDSEAEVGLIVCISGDFVFALLYDSIFVPNLSVFQWLKGYSPLPCSIIIINYCYYYYYRVTMSKQLISNIYT